MQTELFEARFSEILTQQSIKRDRISTPGVARNFIALWKFVCFPNFDGRLLLSRTLYHSSYIDLYFVLRLTYLIIQTSRVSRNLKERKVLELVRNFGENLAWLKAIIIF